MTNVVLSKRAPWATEEEIVGNHLLRCMYRERFALVDGRRFRLSASSLDAMWWVEEVEADGNPTFENHEIVSWCKWAFSLREARELIATLVAGEETAR